MNNKLAKLPVLVRTVLPQHLGCKGLDGEQRPEPAELRGACVDMFGEVLDWVSDAAERKSAPTFREFETGLRERILRLGALMAVLFLALAEQRVSELGDKLKLRGRTYTRRREPKARNLMTWFGVVRYWRTYFFAKPSFDHPGRGVHPTDMMLGLGRSRISLELLDILVPQAVRLEVLEQPLQHRVGEALLVVEVDVLEDPAQAEVRVLDGVEGHVEVLADVRAVLAHVVPRVAGGDVEAVLLGIGRQFLVAVVLREALLVLLLPHVAQALVEEQPEDVVLEVGRVDRAA